jgi:hypothetical protein
MSDDSPFCKALKAQGPIDEDQCPMNFPKPRTQHLSICSPLMNTLFNGERLHSSEKAGQTLAYAA